MNANNTHKYTKIDILPKDWKRFRLGDIAIFFSGGTPLTTNKNYYNGTIPFIKSAEIYFETTQEFLTDEGLQNSSAKWVSKGDLLFALYGANSGEVAVSKIDGVINQAVLCIKNDKQISDTTFLYNYFLMAKRFLVAKFLQGGQGNLSAQIIKQIQIPLPPLAEQEKIAQILGVWDKGISVLKSLIEAKTKRKKALMQRLLTPPKTSHTDFSSCHSDKVCHTEPFSCHTERSEVSKNKGVDCVDTLAFSKHQYDEVLDSCNSAPLCHTEGVAQSIQKDDLQGNAICLDSSVASLPQNDRGKLHNVKNKPNESSLRFAEFTDKWQEMRLGDICEITTGSLNANAMVENGKFAFFTCAREVYAIDNYAFDTEALLVSGNGANVGYIHYYKGKFNAYQRTYVLDKFSCNILFVKFFLDKYLKKRIAQEKNEGNTPYIVLSTLQDMKIVLPNSLAEQKKIAQVLSACDKEIELLKSKFQCLKTQKKGLMQRLLNGEVRVKC